jgi:hypothetical protein
VETGGLLFEGSRGIFSMRPYLKNKLKVKGTGSMAQVVECLPSKCKVQSPEINHQYYHQKKKKKKKPEKF